MTLPSDRYPTAEEIHAELVAFAADPRFSAICTVSDLPERSHENRATNFVRIGRQDAGSPNRNRVLFTGGVHAREWAPPTALTNLISVLLEAFVASSAISIGNSTCRADHVRQIIETVDLFIMPMVNPDGYNFSLSTGTPWRKNRRPAPSPLPPGCSDAAAAIGVDINRNFDVLWDFDLFYLSPSAVQSSKDPCEDIFIGSAAFSEPESRNVRSLLQREPAFYVDVHMFGRTVLHSWGVEENLPVSAATPALNPGRVRDGTTPPNNPPNAYREPIDSSFLGGIEALANLMADATGLATGRRYTPTPGALPVSISGAADDFAFSRNLGTSRLLTRAFTLECGTGFLPDFVTEHPNIEREVQAALLALLANAVTPVTTASSSSNSCRGCS